MIWQRSLNWVRLGAEGWKYREVNRSRTKWLIGFDLSMISAHCSPVSSLTVGVLVSYFNYFLPLSLNELILYLFLFFIFEIYCFAQNILIISCLKRIKTMIKILKIDNFINELKNKVTLKRAYLSIIYLYLLTYYDSYSNRISL